MGATRGAPSYRTSAQIMDRAWRLYGFCCTGLWVLNLKVDQTNLMLAGQCDGQSVGEKRDQRTLQGWRRGVVVVAVHAFIRSSAVFEYIRTCIDKPPLDEMYYLVGSLPRYYTRDIYREIFQYGYPASDFETVSP